ncbi:WD repeat-containing protein 82 [Drosophila teissieri]|uniref:WD repeat-containing protein 82 n=1 Tax=Drosophila teissieri TaxID=7243 RepID=UPI001CBA086C|nr:WD repeat-containing protein 82 [Drosophila teissieri]
MSIRLNDDAMRQFRVAKVFQETDEHKRSMEFSADGLRLLLCDHSALSIFSSTRQVELCQVHMHHYLPDVACFAQQDTRVLHSTSKHDYSIRCLDLNTRLCVRVFGGHAKSVHGLASQPGNENVFISAGRDDQVYMWDFRSSTHTHRIKKLRRPLCAFDPAGLVLATSTGTEGIEIHDVRMLGGQPCQKFAYQVNDKANWTQLQFAPNGKSLLLSTDHSWCFSVSAFDGTYQQSFTGYSNQSRLPLDATYTPDSQFILSGADEGRIHIWRAADGYPVAVLKGNNVGPVRCLRFNPRATMFVSSDLLIVFWMPMANGVYDWVDRLKPGETISITESDVQQEAVRAPSKIPMPKPKVDMGFKMQTLNRKRACAEDPLVDLTEALGNKDSLEDGEISDD